MTFKDYCSIIAESVAETGYDAFRPSACVSRPEQDAMCVLEVDLSEEGDEVVARAWGAALEAEDNPLFLAYRSGHRRVVVLEIRNERVVAQVAVRVDAHVES